MLLLPAVPGEGLAEVAVPVEQADTDERDPEVARRLEVVPGEDAEAAGVLRQGGGDAELGREVGDGGRGSPGWRWYQRSPSVYSRSSAAHTASRSRKPGSAASPVSRSGATVPSSRTGSPWAASQPSGSRERNSSRVPSCQDQRKFRASSFSGASGPGSTGRTVMRRMAFTFPPSQGTQEGSRASGCGLHVKLRRYRRARRVGHGAQGPVRVSHVRTRRRAPRRTGAGPGRTRSRTGQAQSPPRIAGSQSSTTTSPAVTSVSASAV